MYETMTYEVIMQRMLGRVPDSFDKREGSIIFDALAPAAAELAQMYIGLDAVLDQTFADTATNEYLDKRCAERGITRKAATCAVVKGKFTPADVEVLGQRFSCGIYNYVAIKKLEQTEDACMYLLECETGGTAPNAAAGRLIPIEYISKLQSAEIVKAEEIEEFVSFGTDAESDDSLRERYFESVRNQAFGGNIADYRAKVMAIEGVGGVKVTPVWNGGGTVKLTIITANEQDGDTDNGIVVQNVQKIISETAPIGHVVTVEGVKKRSITITTNLSYETTETEWNYEAVRKQLEAAVREYFGELIKRWDERDVLVVRISGIEQKILNCPGIIDVQHTKLDGIESNIYLNADEIPVLGGISDES